MRARRYLVVLIFLILALALLVRMHFTVVDLRAELAEHEAFSSNLWDEYQDAILTNALLRAKLMNLHENLSLSTLQIEACLAQLPTTLTAPQQRIPISDVRFARDSVVINIEDVVPGVIAPTGSMEPLLTEDTIVLELTPESPSEILPGDIIIYELQNDRIIHRVIEVGWDAKGWYAITKGDSNAIPDPEPVRFSDVRGVLVGIIY